MKCSCMTLTWITVIHCVVFFFFFFKRRDVSLLLRSTSGFYKSTQIKFIFSIYLFFYINLKKKKTDHTFFRVVHTVYCLEEPSIHIILNPWEHLWWLGKDELNKISMEEKKKVNLRVAFLNRKLPGSILSIFLTHTWNKLQLRLVSLWGDGDHHLHI